MKRQRLNNSSTIVPGAVAGLAGTGVMLAMLWFDEKYAPKTVATTPQNLAQSRRRSAESAVSMGNVVPTSVRKSSSLIIRTAGGTMFGILYGLLRGRSNSRSTLGDGIVLGTIAYVAGHLGFLPALGLTQPVWKQEFPEIAGELLRHVAYGVATTATYGMTEMM